MTFTVDDARVYIASVPWQFAKTMPQWPHEYTVRQWQPDLEPAFCAFAALIRSEGTVKPWPPDTDTPRYRNTYLEVDGWEYWTMGAPLLETTVINRTTAGWAADDHGSGGTLANVRSHTSTRLLGVPGRCRSRAQSRA